MTDRDPVEKSAKSGVAPPRGPRERRAGPPRVTTQRHADVPESIAASGRNRTGLPDRLQAGVEALCGLDLDEVRVHHNPARPARLASHAFAQGSDIHVASAQETHLPHDTWHVVQQKEGRVRATAQRKEVALNDDASLERAADAMGTRALSAGDTKKPNPPEAG